MIVAAAMHTRLVLASGVIFTATMGAGFVITGVVSIAAAIVARCVLAAAVIGAAAINAKHG
jgi:hypothetical protein